MGAWETSMTMPLWIFTILLSQPQPGSRGLSQPSDNEESGEGAQQRRDVLLQTPSPLGPCPLPSPGLPGREENPRDEKIPRLLSTRRCCHGFLCLPVSYPQDSRWRERLFSYPFYR